jgi:8-oxo-dGTP diphosphatase
MNEPLRSPTVVAAVIRDIDDKVLLARRPQGRHMGGLWEFPGGKVRDGEAPARALVRELVEELGVSVEVGNPITFAVHEEPGMRILLLFYAATIVDGEPRPQEGQAIAWVPRAELDRYPTPPADAALVRQLIESDSA